MDDRRPTAVTRIELLQYQEDEKVTKPAWEILTHPEIGMCGAATGVVSAKVAPQQDDSSRHDHCNQILQDQVRLSFDAGREQGFASGRLAEREAHVACDLTEKHQKEQQAIRLVETFSRQTERYFEAVEAEVVRLALAVSARILRREAQMDQLLLTGAVRVALRQLSSSTVVKLIVPHDDQELWAEAVKHMPNLPVRPKVVARDEMRLGECIIETDLGSVDLGIRAQLAEIERGFFDRAGRSLATDGPPIPAQMNEE